jgi:hypothetical protein
VTIDVHGSLDQVKDVINLSTSGSSPLCRVHAHGWAHDDAVPLLGHQRTPFVPGLSVGRGGSPLPTVDDRPRPVFRRCPAKSNAIPRAGVSFTVTTFHEGKRRLLVLASRVGLPLTPPPLFPKVGRVFFGALQATRGRSPASVMWYSGVQAPLVTCWKTAPGTDDPSTPARPGRRGANTWLIAPLGTAPAAAP